MTIAMAMLGLAGCLSVETNVDAYSSIPDDLEPKTFQIVPFQGMDGSSLQWRTNAQVLAQVLAEKGFTVAPRPSQARLTVYFGFAVDQGERVTTPYSIPQFGITGYGGAQTYGTVYGNRYSGTTTLTPTYGVTGYSTGVITDTIFTRSVAIDMVDNRSRQKVFQARGVSRGPCPSFAPVAVPIIQAVMTNFPKGKTGLVSLPSDSEC